MVRMLEDEANLIYEVLLARDETFGMSFPLSEEERAKRGEMLLGSRDKARTNKKYLGGMREALRGVAAVLHDSSKDKLDKFLGEVVKRTGLSFYEILGDVDDAVSKIVRRGKIRDEFELRLLIDYLSDYPQGPHRDAARDLLIKTQEMFRK